MPILPRLSHDATAAVALDGNGCHKSRVQSLRSNPESPMPSSGRVLAAVSAMLAALALAGCQRVDPPPNNVILFVADGLRSGIVNPRTAPALAAVRDEGVDFANSHSVFPTVTTVNAAALATGHYPGDTGDFGNGIFTGLPALGRPINAVVAPLEEEEALGLMNDRYGGNFLGETSLLELARRAGYSTASIGKLGPTAIQNVVARNGETIIVDDDTGRGGGLPLPKAVQRAIRAAGLGIQARERGLNGKAGAYDQPGTLTPNTQQQRWFVDVATKVVLPRFKQANKPFFMVYWSRDPDGSQHNGGDSLNQLTPGINGPTSLAGIRNASDNLQKLRLALRRLGLERTTNIVVVADHGFSTVYKQSRTSPSARISFRGVTPGFLPVGFLAVDLSDALHEPLWNARGQGVDLNAGRGPGGAAMLGSDPKAPKVVVAANGGADMIWLPGADARALAPRIVQALIRQDYVTAIFVDDALGPVPGTLPLSTMHLVGSARTPRPAILVSFRSFALGCRKPELCTASVADTSLQQGQGIHGSLSRADTHNFMAAIGPDFKRRFDDPAPVGNADIAPTLAKLLRLTPQPRGKLRGRVLEEALVGGEVPAYSALTLRSASAPGGFMTILNLQRVADATYFDAAGAPGRGAVGLKP
jgi:arylsulfatase A-like enzyme